MRINVEYSDEFSTGSESRVAGTEKRVSPCNISKRYACSCGSRPARCSLTPTPFSPLASATSNANHRRYPRFHPVSPGRDNLTLGPINAAVQPVSHTTSCPVPTTISSSSRHSSCHVPARGSGGAVRVTVPAQAADSSREWVLFRLSPPPLIASLMRSAAALGSPRLAAARALALSCASSAENYAGRRRPKDVVKSNHRPYIRAAR